METTAKRMRIFRKLEEIPEGFGASVVAVGNFDGLHRAHQQLIAAVRQRAQELKVRSVLLTFDPHPLRILRPAEAPRLITPYPYKLKLLKQTGVDAVVILPFSRDLSMMPPYEFAERVLAGALHAVEVHEGFNFRFGHRAEGDMAVLKQYGARLGFQAVRHPALRLRGHIVSSSQIRKLVHTGEMGMARHLLARPFTIASTPGRGRGFGTRYAVPTINLSRYEELIPGHGVYVTTIRVSGESFDSVTNVGNRPTFGADSFAIESHILDFHPIELTAESPIELTFHKRLRGEIRFPTVEDLKTQIGLDVTKARRYFHLLRRFHPESLK
jgi:riboflavin kinase/FMN adenylyltransferase